MNILMLAVVCKAVAVPVYWLLLNKKGNSDTRERHRLDETVVRQFGKERLVGVLVDRELIGGRRPIKEKSNGKSMWPTRFGFN